MAALPAPMLLQCAVGTTTATVMSRGQTLCASILIYPAPYTQTLTGSHVTAVLVLQLSLTKQL